MCASTTYSIIPREAVGFATGRSRDDLQENRLLNLALVRLVEIVGEAARQVSEAGQAALPDIPWSQIISMRNRVVHGYDKVDLSVLWDVIQLDLPPLIEQLERILGE